MRERGREREKERESVCERKKREFCTKSALLNSISHHHCRTSPAHLAIAGKVIEGDWERGRVQTILNLRKSNTTTWLDCQLL